MDTWVDNVHKRAAVLHDQISVALEAQRTQGVDMSAFIQSYRVLLHELYTESMPLAGLMDHSDLLFHAEGPGAQHHAAFSAAVGWLCEEVERRVRQLALASLRLQGAALDAAEDDLRVLLNGMAPGSLWAGFSIDSAQRMTSSTQPQLVEISATLDSVRSVVRTLPLIPRFIGPEHVSEEINDLITDPQVRDATLMATYHLSPTGRRGIHTLEISAPRSSEPQTSLTNRERTVLRESAVRRPMIRSSKRGTFIGQVREVDLDSKRFHLRSVPGIGTVRCILHDLKAETARRHIGCAAKVTGTYEADADGRPRLMRVERIEPFQIQKEL